MKIIYENIFTVNSKIEVLVIVTATLIKSNNIHAKTGVACNKKMECCDTLATISHH